MPTSFKVFSLGQLPIWDPQEGNTTLQQSAVTNSLGTYGSSDNPLFRDIRNFDPAGNGFGGGSANSYDIDNNASNDQFSIDGGPAQTFDAIMQFDAVITYKDGTTATITANVMQDVNGNSYWVPETVENADQEAINAQAIRSLELVSPIYANNNAGQGYSMAADRADSDPLCFTRGTCISCPGGPRMIEHIAEGDQVMTMDHGIQTVRWIGRRTYAAVGRLAPIKIKAGTLNAIVDLEVSPQHRILLQGPEAELLFGTSEVLVPAKHLVNDDTITVRRGGEVEYIHLLFDHHEVVWADGVATETLFLGETGKRALDAENLEELHTIFPELNDLNTSTMKTARPVVKGYEAAALIAARSKYQTSEPIVQAV